ncbi:hypothetical protein [Streptomyces sp. C10-9-1]|uniref:hypothetical protein n=1 Tax=Streptomyces sp. C10-9-1 TaxID=1859285 RepID=UPI003F4A0851
MTTVRPGALRTAAPLLAFCVLAAGCSAAPDDGGEGASPSKGSPSAKAPEPSRSAESKGAFVPDADRLPRTRAEALALARAVAFRPEEWGADFVALAPGESAPGTWAVLDDDCRWSREPLPDGVLAAVSRYSELPLGQGRGAVRVTAAVTVHTTEAGADARLSTTLEEAMRCPEQEIRAGERITELDSVGRPAGQGQNYADDSVFEMGTHVRTVDGRALTSPYHWTVDRLGPVTIAVSVRGTTGEGSPEATSVSSHGTVTMRSRLVDLLGEKP